MHRQIIEPVNQILSESGLIIGNNGAAAVAASAAGAAAVGMEDGRFVYRRGDNGSS